MTCFTFLMELSQDAPSGTQKRSSKKKLQDMESEDESTSLLESNSRKRKKDYKTGNVSNNEEDPFEENEEDVEVIETSQLLSKIFQ